MEMRTDSLNPHPSNVYIYNDSADGELIESIRINGVIQPIVITQDGMIISGHRRYSAAVHLGLEFVPVVISEFTDRLDVISAMIEANRQRIKTQEQIVKEVTLLDDIEKERTLQKQKAALRGAENPRCGNIATTSGGLPNAEEESGRFRASENGTSGRRREIISQKTGVKPRTVGKITNTSGMANTLEDDGKAEEAKRIREIQYTTNATRAEREGKIIFSEAYRDQAHETAQAITQRQERSYNAISSSGSISSVSVESETVDIDLLPCPYCGCADVIFIQEHGYRESWSGNCNQCGSTGPSGLSEAEAREQWNRRSMIC